jgi:hypothetical protein
VGDPKHLQALDVAYRITISRSLWIFSFVNVLIGIGMIFEYYLERKSGQGLKKHAILGLVVAGFAFVAWIFELTAFWSPIQVLFTAGIIEGLFILGLCVWCIWLALWIFPQHDLAAQGQQTMEYI